MKNIFLFSFLIIIAIIPINACTGTLTVEPDPQESILRGQVVHFVIPVVYVELSNNDKKEFDKKTFEIGRILETARVGKTFAKRKKERVLVNIPPEMSFTIMESFWVRQDWFTREFAPDYNQVVLKDENGVLSVVLRSQLLDTDRPELGKNDE